MVLGQVGVGSFCLVEIGHCSSVGRCDIVMMGSLQEVSESGEK